LLSLAGQYVRLFPNPLNLNFPLLAHNFVVEFDVNAEANITTYFSVSLALIAAFLLLLIAYFKNAAKDKYRFHWTALALFLLYISIDDASVIHEKVSKYLKGLTSLGGWFEYKWVIVGLVVIGVLALSFFRFWLNLDNKYKVLFLLSAGLFFGGAVGTEMIGGRWAYSFGSNNFTYKVFTTLEQGLQYAGLILLVYSLLLYMRSYFPRFTVSGVAVDLQDGTPALIIQPKWVNVLTGVGIFILVLSVFSEYIQIFPGLLNVRTSLQKTLMADFISEFDFVGKPDIATYYNMLLLDVVVFLLFVVAALKKAAADKYKFSWAALAWIVFFVALDTLAVLHKKVNLHIDELANISGRFTYDPIIAGTVVFIVLFILFLRFWLHLDRKYKVFFLAFALMYFGGELGKEISKSYATEGLPHLAFTAVEQALQYGGSTLLIYALLTYITSCLPQFFVAIKGAKDIN
jgi:hypothetical protein